MDARTGLPPDQGGLGISREPHCRALRLRMARRQRPLVSQLRQRELGIRRRRPDAGAQWPVSPCSDQGSPIQNTTGHLAAAPTITHPRATLDSEQTIKLDAACGLLERCGLHLLGRRADASKGSRRAYGRMEEGGSWETRITRELFCAVHRRHILGFLPPRRTTRASHISSIVVAPTRISAGARARWDLDLPIMPATANTSPRAIWLRQSQDASVPDRLRAAPTRLKIWGTARVVEGDAELIAKLMSENLPGACRAGDSFHRCSRGTAIVRSTSPSVSRRPMFAAAWRCAISASRHWKPSLRNCAVPRRAACPECDAMPDIADPSAPSAHCVDRAGSYDECPWDTARQNTLPANSSVRRPGVVGEGFCSAPISSGRRHPVIYATLYGSCDAHSRARNRE